MKRAAIIALTATSLTAIALPAAAAFYFEGLMPHTEPPNCNDPYATTCGRYGQVPHYQGEKSAKPEHPVVRPDHKVMKPAPRYHTREGLDK